jgi:hypothetical protein
VLTGNNGLTIIVKVLELAGFPDVHASLEVKIQFTVLPSVGMNEYVELVAPHMVIPFTFH